MKKYIAFTIMIFSTLSLSAGDSWIYTGFEYSRLYETVSLDNDESQRIMDSIGVNLSGYHFSPNSPWGLFIHTSFLFPQVLKIKDNDDVSVTLKRDDVVFNYYSSGLAGVAFRTPAWVIQGYGGIGIHGSLLFLGMGEAYYDEYISQKSYAVGIGIDLGCKVNFTDNFYLNVGAMGAWDFYNYTDMNTNGYKVDNEYDSFRTFVINPFGGLGFSF